MKIRICACYNIVDYFNTYKIGKEELAFCYDNKHANEQIGICFDIINQYKDTDKTIVFGTVHGDIPNFIGHLIHNKKLSTSQCDLILFDADHKPVLYYYDDEGYLKNWPFGFFEADYESLGL
jgi:hypothetical protein